MNKKRPETTPHITRFADDIIHLANASKSFGTENEVRVQAYTDTETPDYSSELTLKAFLDYIESIRAVVVNHEYPNERIGIVGPTIMSDHFYYQPYYMMKIMDLEPITEFSSNSLSYDFENDEILYRGKRIRIKTTMRSGQHADICHRLFKSKNFKANHQKLYPALGIYNPKENEWRTIYAIVQLINNKVAKATGCRDLLICNRYETKINPLYL